MPDARRAQDLIVVVADLDAEQAIRQLLQRPNSLDIRPVRFEVDRYPKRDSGCCRTAHEHLRPFINQFDFAMVVFDHHGSGKESQSREEIENALEQVMARNGWRSRSAAVAIAPELEAWVWSSSPEVAQALGWQSRTRELQDWLTESGHLKKGTTKPGDPKQAMKDALRKAHKSHSPAIFRTLAKNVGTARCTDPAFLKFKTTLQQWFARTTP